jgi:ribosome maturation factor RimP
LTARDRVEAIIEECSGREKLCIHGITWATGRIEVILREDVGPDSDAVIGPSIDAINAVHTRIAEAMELDPDMEALLMKNEVLIASPGVGEDLYRDIDFVVFKGFPVTITTTELYKKKTSFEGTLMERTDEYVSVSLKGRIVNVPRNVIDKVSLPTPKFEEADDEMRKLRR